MVCQLNRTSTRSPRRSITSTLEMLWLVRGSGSDVALERSVLTLDQRLVLVTGVLGGFTTYSSFNYETLHLAQSGAGMLAVVNVAVTLVACLLAGIAGIWLGRTLG